MNRRTSYKQWFNYFNISFLNLLGTFRVDLIIRVLGSFVEVTAVDVLVGLVVVDGSVVVDVAAVVVCNRGSFGSAPKHAS
jgi:hypothetical protein